MWGPIGLLHINGSNNVFEIIIKYNTMKKLILFLSLAMLAVVPAVAQNDNEPDFSSVCSSGQVLHYKIVDYGEVYVWPYFQYPEMLGGFINIPRTVRYDGQNYIVTGIADECFANCIRIQGVEMPTTMFVIGDSAFAGCTDLRVVEMPKTLTDIGQYAFAGDTSLIDVVMPNSVVELGPYAFADCYNVRHFVISHTLSYLPEGVFKNCASVTGYIIPASIDSIGCNAFYGYRDIRDITFLGNVPPHPVCDTELCFGRDIPVYVTPRAFDAYKKSYIWGQYPIKSM